MLTTTQYHSSIDPDTGEVLDYTPTSADESIGYTSYPSELPADLLLAALESRQDYIEMSTWDFNGVDDVLIRRPEPEFIVVSFFETSIGFEPVLDVFCESLQMFTRIYL